MIDFVRRIAPISVDDKRDKEAFSTAVGNGKMRGYVWWKKMNEMGMQKGYERNVCVCVRVVV